MFKINPKLYFKLIQKYPLLSYLFKPNNGFKHETKDKRDISFGASDIKKVVLQKDGQWDLPEGERQSIDTETMMCVSASLLNACEILIKRKYNQTKNFSDRFLAKVSYTTKNGNSMSTVLKALRKLYGTVREASWANKGGSWNEFYKTIPSNVLAMGKLWIKEYELQYENDIDNKARMMEALKYSPLWTAGFAWYKKGNLYYSYGRANHAFLVVGYVEGSHWLVFDTYAPFIKKLDWNFKFSYTRMLIIGRKSMQFNRDKIADLKKRGFKYIIRADKINGGSGEIYKLKENNTLKELNAQEKLETGFKELAKSKELTGISENFYNSLIK